MFSKINIENELTKYRSKRIEEKDILEEVSLIFEENEKKRQTILSELKSKPSGEPAQFQVDLLKAENIFHISEIRRICSVYRLRFLDSRYFKADFPEEAVSKIRDLEKEHQIQIKNFKIIAPAKMMKLKSADDPLLFSSLGNGYYYLIHKWGKDLHPLRKWLVWPFRSLENLVFFIFLLSLTTILIIPMEALTQNPTLGEYIFLFLYVFTAICGLTIFYGFSWGKNFNAIIWNSRFYNG